MYQFKGFDREILNPVQGFLGNQNFKMSHESINCIELSVQNIRICNPYQAHL